MNPFVPAARGGYLASCRRSAKSFASSAARYPCTSRTAVAPSPTAEATRLIERKRLSPAAKTPGLEVSSGRGARSTGHLDRRPASPQPVRWRITAANCCVGEKSTYSQSSRALGA